MKASRNSKKAGGAGGGEDQSDEYYDEAVKLVIESNQASVSILQTTFTFRLYAGGAPDRYDGTKRHCWALCGK